jgi:pimeloyl-ACP methyl ester carboxylesterase
VMGVERMRCLFMVLVLTASSLLSASELTNTGDGIYFPSTVGTLKLFMRHQAPTGLRRGPPVLILHGASFPSGNSAGWRINGRSWMDELASAGYEVYALDFLGYGNSDRYPEMSSTTSAGVPLGSVESLVNQVECAAAQILKAQGGQNINLIAHSAGTFVAARYAQLHSDRVSRLVLFGAPAPSGDPLPTSAAAEQDVARRYLEVSRENQLNAFDARVREAGHLDPAMFDAWANAYLATDPGGGNRHPPSVRVPAGLAAALEDMDRRGLLPYDPKQISVPVLVIQGEWDSVAPVSSALRLFTQLGSPLKRFVVLGQAGHRAHLETNRRSLFRETEAFLRGDDSTEGPTR